LAVIFPDTGFGARIEDAFCEVVCIAVRRGELSGARPGGDAFNDDGEVPGKEAGAAGVIGDMSGDLFGKVRLKAATIYLVCFGVVGCRKLPANRNLRAGSWAGLYRQVEMERGAFTDPL
jgi:hypothetical protein